MLQTCLPEGPRTTAVTVGRGRWAEVLVKGSSRRPSRTELSMRKYWNLASSWHKMNSEGDHITCIVRLTLLSGGSLFKMSSSERREE